MRAGRPFQIAPTSLPDTAICFRDKSGFAPAHVFLLVSKTREPRASTSEAMARAELYFATHPGSPSAIRRPVLLPQSAKWIAILGNGAREESTLGSGETVEAALQAFDAQSLAINPPLRRKLRRPKSTKEILKAIVSEDTANYGAARSSSARKTR
jgi:hypothetical protein